MCYELAMRYMIRRRRERRLAARER